jgi:SAM-dependent methyltransferase
VSSSFKDHFSSIAGSYAAFRPDYPPELFRWLASASPAHNAAWDCATGSGQAALGLVDCFHTVFATDASSDQITNAAQKPGVRYFVAPAEKSGLPLQSVDLITVAQAAHWFDLDAFYSEVRRVLRPGGCVALWCYGVTEFENSELQRLTNIFYHSMVGPYWPPERRLVEEGYRSLSFPFFEFEAPVFEMHAEFTLERFLGYVRTWSATQRFTRAQGFDPVEKLAEELAPYWPTSGPSPRIRWPISIRVGHL